MITKFDVRKLQGRAYQATLGRIGTRVLERGNSLADRHPKAVRVLFKIAKRVLPEEQSLIIRYYDNQVIHFRWVRLGPLGLFRHMDIHPYR
jgi:hypothetical protein